MDPYISGIDPLSAIGSNINFNKIRAKSDAKKDFAAIFVSQILKEVFKSQSSMFGEEDSLGMSSNDLYNDILLAKISGEIASNKAFGFDKLMMGKK